MSTARKLFRLCKSFNEYVKIQTIRAGKLPEMEKTLQVLARLGFLCYWFFDNLSVLIKVKFLDRSRGLDNWDLKAMARRASKCWLIGIWLSILVSSLELYKASKKQS